MPVELKQAQEIYQLVIEFLTNYSFQLLGAIIILVIGILIARKAGNAVFALCQRKQLDITLSHFTASVTRLLLVTMVVIIALGKLGISVTPFIAAVGALSLGAGLAVQGLLSNYGAGLNIIITRPYVVGDTIQVKGVSGIVREVRLAFTILSNEDEVMITIPNRHIMGEILHNSQQDTVLELSVGISYHSDPQQAIAVISQALSTLEHLSQKRQPLVGIDQFGDSSIDLGIRCWVKTEKLFETRYQANLAIHQALEAQKIEIPFPQREIKIHPREPAA
ncbi:mechanosensitive ion channel family protein [Dongshaea marina]|uniref:mechanosensitive ion channel family protein n=1 Tax=Dongshaea marina TaxID=2047966 RepID=UPI000D3E75C7|nr:mechanosensitive ion channel family protein [Dongshaea marina]